MATKKIEIKSSLPIDVCYDLLRQTADKIGWKTKEAKKEENTIVFKKGRSFSSDQPVTTTAHLTLVGRNQTRIVLTAKRFGLFDPTGVLDDALQSITDPFKASINNKSSRRGSNQRYCSNCGTSLVAKARFCSSCGAKQL